MYISLLMFLFSQKEDEHIVYIFPVSEISDGKFREAVCETSEHKPETP